MFAFRDLSFPRWTPGHSLSTPLLALSSSPSFRDIITSHHAAIFSSSSLRVNLPIEISVGRGTEWSTNRQRMMILPLSFSRSPAVLVIPSSLSNYSPSLVRVLRWDCALSHSFTMRDEKRWFKSEGKSERFYIIYSKASQNSLCT